MRRRAYDEYGIVAEGAIGWLACGLFALPGEDDEFSCDIAILRSGAVTLAVADASPIAFVSIDAALEAVVKHIAEPRSIVLMRTDEERMLALVHTRRAIRLLGPLLVAYHTEPGAARATLRRATTKPAEVPMS